MEQELALGPLRVDEKDLVPGHPALLKIKPSEKVKKPVRPPCLPLVLTRLETDEDS